MGGSGRPTWRKVLTSSTGSTPQDARSAKGAQDDSTETCCLKPVVGMNGAAVESGTVALLWLRNDLRLRDNALFHCTGAIQAKKLLVVFCFDPRHYGPCASLHPCWSKGAKHISKTGVLRARFLVESVNALQQSLRDLGSELFVAHGRPEEVLPNLASELLESGHSCVRVLCQQEVAQEDAACEATVSDALASLGPMVSLEAVWGVQTLYDAKDFLFGFHHLPEPFTAFRNVVESNITPVAVPAELPAPSILPPPIAFRPCSSEVDSGNTDALLHELGFSADELEQRIDPRCANSFSGGEAQGLERLEDFVKAGLATYKQTRATMGIGCALQVLAYVGSGSISSTWRSRRSSMIQMPNTSSCGCRRFLTFRRSSPWHHRTRVWVADEKRVYQIFIQISLSSVLAILQRPGRGTSRGRKMRVLK